MHSKQKVLKPKLENCNKRSKQYPTTFWIPSTAQLDALRVGDLAKVISQGERFWVYIHERKGNDFVGKIDNDLDGTDRHKLKYGDLIAFKRENICDIDQVE